MKTNVMSFKMCMMIWFAVLTLPIFAQQYELSDEAITERIDSEMFRNLDVPANLIDVETTNGIVTLDGTVNNILAKERTEELISAIKGVRGIINRIDVETIFVSDHFLKQSILKNLATTAATDNYDDIAVDAEKGKVTLSGTVPSWQAKRLIGYTVKGVKGVVELQNNLNVTYDADRSDAEIEQEISKAILNDIRLYPNLLEIKVLEGVVGLSGAVGSLYEKKLVTSYAWTSGVKEVLNDELKIYDWAKNEHLMKEEYPDRTDEEILQGVKDLFLYDPRVDFFKPDISVNEGVVVLSGVVDNLNAKTAAEEDAKNVIGVSYVKNNLKVRPSMIPENNVLKNRVSEALKRDPYIERYEIDIVAWNGKVYLFGEVDNYFEKYQAETVASSQEGVIDLVNKIEVLDDRYYPNFMYDSKKTWSYDYESKLKQENANKLLSDQQIKDNIEEEFWWSFRIKPDNLQVVVEQGVVTLTGQVTSEKARDVALQKAWKGGALVVVDDLEVK